ncbi:hypothetical protein GCM10025331_81740 [Actinoplanes utahensis]|nr:hypothetical protein Aut01nite_52280 [Actinoplanes utahensis]
MIVQDRRVQPGQFVQNPFADLFRSHPDHHLRGRFTCLFGAGGTPLKRGGEWRVAPFAGSAFRPVTARRGGRRDRTAG